MIITISGKPGSGKSTIAKMIAEKYKLKHYSTGSFFRERAKKLGISLKKFSEMAENSEEHDKEADEWQKNLGMNEDNFVIDGRLSHVFIKNAIRIYLDVNKEVGVKRIMDEKREDENPIDKLHAIHLWDHRVNSEHKRYTDYYGIDIHEPLQYDLSLNTSFLSKEEVLKKVCKFVDNFEVHN